MEFAGRHAAPLAQNRRLANRLLAAFTRETVIHLELRIARAHAAETRPDLAHLPPVQKLMVHIHQVFMHETVMTRHLTAKPPRAERRINRGGQRRKRHRLGARRIAGKHENQPSRLTARISAHAVRQFILAQIRHIDAGAGLVIGPAVVTAAQRAPFNNAGMQRHLTVRATIFQREYRAILRPHQHNRLAGEFGPDRGAGAQFARPRNRIPMVRVCADAA